MCPSMDSWYIRICSGSDTHADWLLSTSHCVSISVVQTVVNRVALYKVNMEQLCWKFGD